MQRFHNRIAAQSPPAIPWCCSGKTVLHGGITNGAAWLQAEILSKRVYARARIRANHTNSLIWHNAVRNRQSYCISIIICNFEDWQKLQATRKRHIPLCNIAKSPIKRIFSSFSLHYYNVSKKRREKFGSLHTIVNCMIPLNYLIILPQIVSFVKREKVYIA